LSNTKTKNLDVQSAKTAIQFAFPAESDLNSLEIMQSGEARDIKLFNNDVLYSVSVIMAKRSEEDCERWLYSVLKSDVATNEIAWKYVHPITNVVYADPGAVDYKTLPFVV
jgi:hypothetical protein